MKTFAGFWQRLGAFALDYLLIAGYLAILFIAVTFVNAVTDVSERLFSNRILAQLTGFLLITLPISLYFALAESSVRQASWGKQRLGLQVTDSNGRRISFWRALARTLLKFVPWELSHTLIWWITFKPNETSPLLTAGFIAVYALVGANLLSLLLSKSRQTIYDRLTTTYVIKK